MFNSLEAQQIRKTAASVRDDRADAHRRRAYELLTAEEMERAEMRRAYAERDRQRELADLRRIQNNWDAASAADMAAREADKQGDAAAMRSIAHVKERKRELAEANALLAENDRYDAQERARKQTEEEGN